MLSSEWMLFDFVEDRKKTNARPHEDDSDDSDEERQRRKKRRK